MLASQLCVFDDKTDSKSTLVKKLIVWVFCAVENKKGMKWKMAKLKGRFGVYMKIWEKVTDLFIQ